MQEMDELERGTDSVDAHEDMFHHDLSKELEDEEEDFEQEEPCKDLFSEAMVQGCKNWLQHVKQAHGLDLAELRISSEYDWIKVINFCRKRFQDGGVGSVAEVVETVRTRWQEVCQDEQYLRPVLDDDPVLYSFDDLGLDKEAGDDQVGNDMAPEEKIRLLEGDIKLLREKVQQLLSEAADRLDGQSMGSPEDMSKAAIQADYDHGYFDSYGHLDIHEDMLKDRSRTESYRDALERAVTKDSVVIDVGCGTSILSLFAARAGAKFVMGIDASKMLPVARRIVATNGFGEDRLKLIEGKVEDLLKEEPEKAQINQQADIIVSEWMGYGLLFESMLDSVLDARDKWLKPGGIMLPCQAGIFVEGQSNMGKYEFWDNVYGFDFSELGKLRPKQALVEKVEPETIISDRPLIFDIDIMTVRKEDLDFTAATVLTITKDGPLTGIVISFDCEMVKGMKDLILSTSPHAVHTHWHQTVLCLDDPLQVKAGETVNVSLSYQRNDTNVRDIDITLIINSKIVKLFRLK